MIRRLHVIVHLLMSMVFIAGPAPAATKAALSRKPPETLLKTLFSDACRTGCSEEEKSRWRECLRWELYDLNNDSIEEYFLYIDHSDWCGAGGSNCSVWVYQKHRGSYVLLACETRLRPLKTYTRGYLDLYGDHRMGASKEPGKWEYIRAIYKFDGNKYKADSEKTVLKKG